MNSNGFPLRSNLKRPVIGDLNQTLSSRDDPPEDSEKPNQQFGALTRQMVLDLQKEHGLSPTGTVDEQSVDLISTEEALYQFIVKGRIVDQTGGPRSGLTVRAFDRNVAVEDTLLGQAATGEQGDYLIRYSLDQLGGKPAPDLVLGVYQAEVYLQESEVIFDAQPVEVKDFVIPVQLQLPEFERLSAALRPLLRQLPIGPLTSNQIDFIAKKTGFEACRIEWLATCHQLAGDDEPLIILFYALQAEGFPANPAALLKRSPDEIRRAVGHAQVHNLIPAISDVELDQILNVKLPRLKAEMR
jgi:hypothetical protein